MFLLSPLSLWAPKLCGHIAFAAGVTPPMLLPHSLLLSCPITAPQTAHACRVSTFTQHSCCRKKPIHYARLTSLRSGYSATPPPSTSIRSALEEARTDHDRFRDHLGENSNMNLTRSRKSRMRPFVCARNRV